MGLNYGEGFTLRTQSVFPHPWKDYLAKKAPRIIQVFWPISELEKKHEALVLTARKTKEKQQQGWQQR